MPGWRTLKVVKAAARALWAVASNDLWAWLRSPWSVAAAILPPVGMGVLVTVLTISAGRQPVALVVDASGPQTARMSQSFIADHDAYRLKTLTLPDAQRALRDQRIAAIIHIPSDFESSAPNQTASVELILNNVDVDFADDLRRSATRSVAQFDAPQLGGAGVSRGALVLEALSQVKRDGEVAAAPAPSANPDRVVIQEHDERRTNVSLLRCQVVPILMLAIINVGLLGTALLCAREFERHTVKLLLLAPVSRATLIGGKVLSGVLATTAVAAPLVVLAALRGALRPPATHWPPLLALLAAVTVFSVGLGLLVGVVLRQSRVIAVLGLNLATCLFFLGGGFTTVAFLPPWLQTISHALPTSYAIDGLRQALFYPDLNGFGRDMLVLCASAALAIVLGGLAQARGWSR